MTFNYPRAAQTAQRLIANFGQSATLRKSGTETGPAYDPTMGAPVDATITVVDLSRKERDAQGVVTGVTRTLYVSASGSAPEKGDQVQIGGKWHDITEVRPLAPGGTNVFYEADLAR